MTCPDEDDPEEMRGAALALAMCRAMLAGDDGEVDAICADLVEMVEDGDPDHHAMACYDSHLALLACQFAHAAFGDGADAMLAAMQEHLMLHVAGDVPGPAT